MPLRLPTGNNAPEKKNIGITRKFMIRGNACMSSMREPTVVPMAVKSMAIKNMKTAATGSSRVVLDTKAGDQAKAEDDKSLDHCDCRAAERPAKDDLDAGDRRDEGLFQEAELLVPEYLDAGKHRGKQDGHRDDARGEELDVIAVAGFLVSGTEPKSHREEKEERLGQGGEDAGARAAVALELPEPEDVDDAHVLPQTRPMARCGLSRRPPHRGWRGR